MAPCGFIKANGQPCKSKAGPLCHKHINIPSIQYLSVYTLQVKRLNKNMSYITMTYKAFLLFLYAIKVKFYIPKDVCRMIYNLLRFCGHGCSYSSMDGKCCHCRDNRAFIKNNKYPYYHHTKKQTYITRDYFYCPTCKHF